MPISRIFTPILICLFSRKNLEIFYRISSFFLLSYILEKSLELQFLIFPLLTFYTDSPTYYVPPRWSRGKFSFTFILILYTALSFFSSTSSERGEAVRIGTGEKLNQHSTFDERALFSCN
jgi:hypothetical protein